MKYKTAVLGLLVNTGGLGCDVLVAWVGFFLIFKHT